MISSYAIRHMDDTVLVDEMTRAYKAGNEPEYLEALRAEVHDRQTTGRSVRTVAVAK